jgi:hypothetical protein
MIWFYSGGEIWTHYLLVRVFCLPTIGYHYLSFISRNRPLFCAAVRDLPVRFHGLLENESPYLILDRLSLNYQVLIPNLKHHMFIARFFIVSQFSFKSIIIFLSVSVYIGCFVLNHFLCFTRKYKILKLRFYWLYFFFKDAQFLPTGWTSKEGCVKKKKNWSVFLKV